MSEPQGEEVLEDAYPFYELKFIMRVLDHEGKAPIEDWRTARGMAREIFERWHPALSKGASGEPVAWHVIDSRGHIHHASSWPGGCHEHINDAINEHDLEDARNWVVRPVYYAPPVPQQEPLVAVQDLLPEAYLDPPDGGEVTLREQFERMAKDAKRYRWLRNKVGVGTGKAPYVCSGYGAGTDPMIDSASLDYEVDRAILAAKGE